MIIFEYSLVFFQISFLALFLSVSGFLLRKTLIDNNHSSLFEEDALFGFIFIGFLALFLNFLIPLTKFFNTIIFMIIFICGFKFNFFKQNINQLLLNIFYSSLICFILYIYSTVNRPDAWLYHLPYSKIVNEHKIIIGLANLDSRFGHPSIFQYISSFFYNHFFSTNGLLMPIGLVTSFFFVYCFKFFLENTSAKKFSLISYFVFLILTFSLYSFNRYSGYGNDAQLHIYYFFITIFLLKYFLKEKKYITFKEIIILSAFIFLIKSTFIFVLFIPFVIFLTLKNKKKIIKSLTFIFSSFMIVLWLLKNILTSGCVIYPLNISCVEKLPWVTKNTIEASLTIESWSKAWPDRENKNIKKENYTKNFNWVNTWSKSHFQFIIKKLTPIFILIILNILFFYFIKCLKKNNNKVNTILFLIIFIFNSFLMIIWFSMFPVYRFGISIIYVFILSILYFLYIRYVDFNRLFKFQKLFTNILIVFFIIAGLKNLVRISDNFTNSISPNLNEPFIHESNITKIFTKQKIFSHYKTNKNFLCGYSPSPCINNDSNPSKDIFFGYIVFYDE